MILERSRTDYRFSEDELSVWTPEGRKFESRFVRDRKNGASRETIEDFLENDDRFRSQYVITPAYIFFESEEDAILFQLMFINY